MEVQGRTATECKEWRSLRGILGVDEASPYEIQDQGRHQIVIANILEAEVFSSIVIHPIPIEKVNLQGFYRVKQGYLMRDDFSCCIGRVFCRQMAGENGSEVYLGPREILLVVPERTERRTRSDFAFLVIPEKRVRQPGDPEKIREEIGKIGATRKESMKEIVSAINGC